jgi:hypothetical protein
LGLLLFGKFNNIPYLCKTKPMTNRIHLDDLRNGCSGILPSLGSFMCDCAIYMFESQGHTSGMTLQVQLDPEESTSVDYVVQWEGGLSLQMLHSMNDEERAVDFGAMCIALLLVMHRTEYQYFIFSKKGTGIDFLLFRATPKDAKQKPDALLEVSGIGKPSRTNTITIRYKSKKEQVKQSDHLNVPVYIVITEFNHPKTLFAYNEPF